MKQLIQLGVVIAVCTFLSGCDSSGGGGSSSPEAVAKAFAEIWDSEMLKVETKQSHSGWEFVTKEERTLLREKVKDYVTSSFENSDSIIAVDVLAERGIPKINKENTYLFLDCKISANKAVVQYTRKNLDSHRCVIELIKIDGKWKVTKSEQSDKPLESFL